MRGVLLLSIGNVAYARWAHNMAVSVRAVSPSLPIHVLTDGNFPAEPWHEDIVDKVIHMDRNDTRDKGGRVFPAKAKLSLYKYSEFDSTIYLDVDGCVIKDLEPLFDVCEESHFQIQVNGVSTLDNDNLDASLWAKPEIIIDKYGLGDDAVIPGTNSSFMYFKRGNAARAIFTKANAALKKPIPVSQLRYSWGESETHPDELYINIALAQTGYIPNIPPVLYLRKRQDRPDFTGFEQIKANRYIIGCWGGLQYNHHEVSGNGDGRTGLYNKVMINAYQEVYGKERRLSDHFYRLIEGKVFNKSVAHARV